MWRLGTTRIPPLSPRFVNVSSDLKVRTEALHWAAKGNKNPAVIAVLLDAGADLKARDTRFGLLRADPKGWKRGLTPLHWAAKDNENPAVITALLDAGADPRTLDLDGKTPWDYAKDREPLKGSNAYWRLNEARF